MNLTGKFVNYFPQVRSHKEKIFPHLKLTKGKLLNLKLFKVKLSDIEDDGDYNDDVDDDADDDADDVCYLRQRSCHKREISHIMKFTN